MGSFDIFGAGAGVEKEAANPVPQGKKLPHIPGLATQHGMPVLKTALSVKMADGKKGSMGKRSDAALN